MHLSREMSRFEVVDLSSRRGDRTRYPARNVAMRFGSTMVFPRRIRPLTRVELEHLNVDRLLAYREQMLCLENSLAASDYTNIVDSLDETLIWFKDDPRWQSLYDLILYELGQKQKADAVK